MPRPPAKKSAARAKPAAKKSAKSAKYAVKYIPRQMSHSARKHIIPRIKGRGDYSSAMSSGNKVGGAIGDIFGPVAGLAGRALGTGAGALFHLITGRGDYKVHKNSLINMGTKVPTFNDGLRATIVTHREFLGDITGSTNFVNRVYPINAGMIGSYPWLQALAQNYEQYRIHGQVYQFKSTSANAVDSTNTALGTVVMCTEYDSTRPDFTSKMAMENHVYCTSTKPSQDMLHPVECAPSDTTLELLYTRTGAIPANADIRMYDLGKFQLATVGMQAAAVIGELWCTYEIELLKPKLSDGLGVSILSSHYNIPITGFDASHLYGTDPPATTDYQEGSNIEVVFPLGATNIFTFTDAMQQGNYLIKYAAFGSLTTLTTGLDISGVQGGLSLLNIWAGDSIASITNIDGSASNVMQICVLVNINRQPGSTLAGLGFVTNATVPTGVDFIDFFVTQTNSFLLSEPTPEVAKKIKNVKQIPQPEFVEEKKEEVYVPKINKFMQLNNTPLNTPRTTRSVQGDVKSDKSEEVIVTKEDYEKAKASGWFR